MKGILVTTIALLFGAFYFPFVHYTEPTEIGISRNWISGELHLDTPGWNITAPWVTVAKVDVPPLRICVTTAGRGFSCKLVQFKPEAFKAFVAVEGFYYYWWANRISFNFGYDDEYRGMKDLLRGYAYGVKQYPFVTTLRNYNEGE